MQKLKSCPGEHIGFKSSEGFTLPGLNTVTCGLEDILRPLEKAVISEMFDCYLAEDIGARQISEACQGRPV